MAGAKLIIIQESRLDADADADAEVYPMPNTTYNIAMPMPMGCHLGHISCYGHGACAPRQLVWLSKR